MCYSICATRFIQIFHMCMFNCFAGRTTSVTEFPWQMTTGRWLIIRLMFNWYVQGKSCPIERNPLSLWYVMYCTLFHHLIAKSSTCAPSTCAWCWKPHEYWHGYFVRLYPIMWVVVVRMGGILLLVFTAPQSKYHLVSCSQTANNGLAKYNPWCEMDKLKGLKAKDGS